MPATEHIQLRTTPHTKAILEQASQALGVSVSYFILDSAYQRATQTVRDINQIRLNDDEWQRAIAMLDALAKPPIKVCKHYSTGVLSVLITKLQKHHHRCFFMFTFCLFLNMTKPSCLRHKHIHAIMFTFCDFINMRTY